MTENQRFLVQVGGISLSLLAVSVLTLNIAGKDDLIVGVAGGFAVSLLNISFAYFSLAWAFDKPVKTFFAVVLGGMGIRVAILGAALFFVWKFSLAPLGGFIVSLVVFYLILQIIEIRFIQRSLANRKATA